MIIAVDYSGYVQVKVTDKSKTSLSGHFLSSAEASICHIILHDLNGIGIFNLHVGYFVKSHIVPKSHCTNLFTLIIVQQCRSTGLPTGQQGGIGRELRVKVRLTGTSTSQFYAVIIVLYQWDESRQDMEFQSFAIFVSL